jgi:hypothetical protein
VGSERSTRRASVSHCTVGAQSHGLGTLQPSSSNSMVVVPMKNAGETLVWV